MMRNDATEAQVRAADPSQSTWLSANAGSGKTRVLVDRVARLLMGGTEPQKILCLTYTKAAASEMQNRLFDRLGKWAMLPEARLRDALLELGVETVDRPTLARARRLFARAIETPGGLKIQTIHSFCASLLRRFPLEARVSPDFREMDDRAARLMREEIVEELAAGTDTAAFDAIAGFVSGEDLSRFLGDLCRNSLDFPRDPNRNTVLAMFDLAEGYEAADLVASTFMGGEAELIADLIPLLLGSGTRDSEAAEKLRALSLDSPDVPAIEGLERVLLHGKGAAKAGPFTAKTGAFPTKSLREGSAAPLMPALEALMLRVEAARNRRIALAAAERTHALHRFAAAFLPRYVQRKAQGGWLDFDDLIARAATLLSDRSVAAWVLFRLDGGIDHILVDEAQDTSPSQWQVIERLAEEFTSGEGARDAVRTIFVVGDKKQSIYSFQGADLTAFDDMKRHFTEKHKAASISFHELELLHSFRSSTAILNIVDLTFDERINRGLGGAFKHIAFKNDLPGRVDLWPVVAPVSKPDEKEWFDPTDILPDDHHTVVLARQIAGEIRRLIDTGTQIDTKDGPRRVHEGDFLILVQRRSELFHEIIRACKAAGLDIAGADRLKIGGELAVKDLAALLGFLATPEDDLALAAALRSPLFGWSESQLFDLAYGRGDAYLWSALRERAGDFPETAAVLSDLRDQADFLRPFDLIERMLTRHDGRRKLLARLGPEAEDGIDALLAQALAFEQVEVPSLTGFLVWMETEDVEVKRQLDTASKAIRVMTVHGAKGLESPIVILPDTAKPTERIRDEILQIDGIPVWRTKTDESPPPIAREIAAALERQREERMRLLYVAMTRAEVWLIVCAAGDVGQGADSWYGLVADAMKKSGAVKPDGVDAPSGSVLRHSFGVWPEASAARTVSRPGLPTLPAWVTERAPAIQGTRETLSPSGLGGAKALPGEAGLDEDVAKQRGVWLHRLLEHLPLWPEQEWSAIAHALINSGDETPLSGEIESILAEARSVIASPEMDRIFAEGTLAEAELTACVPALGGRRLRGTIDRLMVRPDMVLAIDYKSNAIVPDGPQDVPEGILRQMGAYAAMLAEIYPDRRIETAILWTRTGQLMSLDPDIVRGALARTTIP
ncbi:double-strand break repair helicase AddA [Defluviimonas aestuarii]|uniref:double-strand break repair helicase AddA n=1 Tax=Albidovulum aestuarii TaxID=1130726 RepID=UPI00249B3E96|nr:double-strand break repair helicase AddA [Defluviimonas aestuarii]MDI3337841.1 double-strand break repair helicase AddA [Defluviimonas aestuarii]